MFNHGSYITHNAEHGGVGEKSLKVIERLAKVLDLFFSLAIGRFILATFERRANLNPRAPVSIFKIKHPMNCLTILHSLSLYLTFESDTQKLRQRPLF